MTEETTLPENELAKRRRVRELTEQMADLCKDAGDRFLELHDIGVDTRDIVAMVADHFSPRVKEMFDAGQITGLSFGIDSVYCNTVLPTPTNDAERVIFFKQVSALMGKYDELGGGGAVGAMYNQVQSFVDRKVRDPGLGRTPIQRVIDRLFAEAPKLEGADGTPVPDQAPAVECVIVLKSAGIPPISGVLSQTPEGTLRMLSPTQVPDPTKDPRSKAMKPIMLEQFFDVDEVAAVVVQRDVTAERSGRIIS